jgi:hypothetical protein
MLFQRDDSATKASKAFGRGIERARTLAVFQNLKKKQAQNKLVLPVFAPARGTARKQKKNQKTRKPEKPTMFPWRESIGDSNHRLIDTPRCLNADIPST